MFASQVFNQVFIKYYLVLLFENIKRFDIVILYFAYVRYENYRLAHSGE